jgi:hypothetical protein
MAIANIKDMSIANPAAAETMAAAIWQSADAVPGTGPVVASARRQLKRFAHELCEVHGLDPAEVLADSDAGIRIGNGHIKPTDDHQYASTES